MTEKPRDSALRDAFVGILMTVGPFFGVRYRPPRVEIPVVTTPATETEEDLSSDGLTSARPLPED
ncbi:MAG: hypothetical protein JF886_07240 [Candidatus Dormibacteraeota bacterium]|uniref:Uncharacterized protein n=1 Tax=Candidatus Aeolococcus gillhamiae TaxID=3127015 RepID=A0A2W5Z9C0_9BACT|nr:hypothetical protein [Candidatus Dormibacteraeota bacterium]PZR80597.1 MAG: hypothetical protein DLM65_07655 [Candidatus Dormibacter sp. RRmetagenome_bin12]